MTAGPATAIASEKPVVNVLPEVVVGHVAIGERMGCGTGSWSGSELSFTYRWVRDGRPIPANEEGESVSRRLNSADRGSAVWCIVTATRHGESTEAESWNSIELEPGSKEVAEAPKPIAPFPTVSGKAEVGATLTCSQGMWTGKPAPSYTYTWLRSGEAIPGAASSTYVLAGQDEGNSVSCRVTATNSAGSNSANSSNSIEPPGKPPNAIRLPEVSGIREVGNALTCQNPESDWEGSRPLTYQYRWLRDGSTQVSSASTYIVEAADEGQSLQCDVTAKNSKGSSTADSAAVKIAPKRPESTKQPEVKGTAAPESTVECSTGTWTGKPTGFVYEWVHESASGEATLVGGPSLSNKFTTNGERGYTLYCEVTAENEGGRASRKSPPFLIPELGGEAPKATGFPRVSGIFERGRTLVCSEGEWTNRPTKFVYQWVRDPNQSGEVSLELGTKSSYTVAAEDEGHSLSCRVTAINEFGKATGESQANKIKGGVPTLIGPAPEVIGNVRVGESLTCIHGGWSGAPKPTFTYSWYRDGVDKIASGIAYEVKTADRGEELTCQVLAENVEGKTSATTSAVVVPGAPPVGETPSISGEAALGATLACEKNSWTGAPAPAITYQWLLSGVAIPSETGPEYTVTAADRGLVITCSVTGSSREGTSTATSAGVHIPGVRPQEQVAPQVSGSATLGATLTCNRGIWKGAPPPSFTYQWLRDGGAIASATSSTYIVEAADQGHLLSCNVIAANSEGKVEAESVNGLAVPFRLSTSSGVSGFKAGATAPVVAPLTPAVILADLSRELTKIGRALRLSSVLKHGGFTFSFTPPAPGMLELRWYRPAKPAHGSTKKVAALLLGRTSSVFTAAVKHTARLRLTVAGRHALKGHKRYKLEVKAAFTIVHGKPVTWTGTLVLSH